MLRAFIGVPLPATYQDGLAALIRTWRGRIRPEPSWTKTGNWHLTLKFLGDVPEAQLPELRAALAAVPLQAFTLCAGGGGVFPPAAATGKAPPRVLWAGLAQGGEACEALAGLLEQALAPLGYAPERRPFSPHLTLARMRVPSRNDRRRTPPPAPTPNAWAALLEHLASLAWPEVRVDRFVLWKSTLSPGGSVYEPLAEFLAQDCA